MRTVIAVVTFLLVAAPAQARAAELFHWSDADGNPVVKVTSLDRSMTAASWSSCADGGAVCVPIASTATAQATPGATAPGTVFEAVVTYADQSEQRLRTPAWQGGFAVATPPTVLGAPVVGAPISVDWGSTQGGWVGTARTAHRWVIACERPAAGACYVISNGGMDTKTIDARWTGWYLTADVLWESGPDDLLRPLGWAIPPYALSDLPPVTRFAARSATVGPVAPAVTPGPAPVAASRIAPSASLRARPRREHGRLTVGTVTCADRCIVSLKVSGGGHRAYRTSLPVQGTQRLTMPVRRGALSIRVVVDGKLVTTGRVRYGAKR